MLTRWAQGHPSPSKVAMGLGGALCWDLSKGTLLGASVDVTLTLAATRGASQRKVGVKDAEGASQGGVCVCGESFPTPPS